MSQQHYTVHQTARTSYFLDKEHAELSCRSARIATLTLRCCGMVVSRRSGALRAVPASDGYGSAG